MRYDHIDGIALDDSINRGMALIIDCNVMQSETEYIKRKRKSNGYTEKEMQ